MDGNDVLEATTGTFSLICCQRSLATFYFKHFLTCNNSRTRPKLPAVSWWGQRLWWYLFNARWFGSNHNGRAFNHESNTAYIGRPTRWLSSGYEGLALLFRRVVHSNRVLLSSTLHLHPDRSCRLSLSYCYPGRLCADLLWSVSSSCLPKFR